METLTVTGIEMEEGGGGGGGKPPAQLITTINSKESYQYPPHNHPRPSQSIA